MLHVRANLLTPAVYFTLNITYKYLRYVSRFEQACKLQLISVENFSARYAPGGGGFRVLYLSKIISWVPAFTCMYKILWF
jgi:hypothetical protein